MWHCAWGGECHIDARWRLRRRAAFNRFGGWVSLCYGLCVCFVVLLCNLFPFAWGGFLVLCFFLDLRLYLLMLVEEVLLIYSFFPLSIFIVLVVCCAGIAVVGVVGVGGLMVWAMCWLCCVFFSFCLLLF